VDDSKSVDIGNVPDCELRVIKKAQWIAKPVRIK
jgi:hypothetical protein